MTETVKTLIYAAVALVGGLLAIFVSLPPREVINKVNPNEKLYADFDDPKDAARLLIVKIDEKKGEYDEFEVERSPDGRWVIPSHGGYPADAAAQMSATATSLININVIDVASEVPGEQEMFGVVEPTESRLKAGDKGFGTLIAFQDRKGKDLARLIIGKEVEGNAQQRFVRKAGQDRIYVVEFDTSKLSTNFSDWIEKDLLKISPWDIDVLTIKDHQFVAKASGDGRIGFAHDPRMDLTVSWDNDTNGWLVDKLVGYARQRPVPAELKPDEELNKDALDTVKSTLDNLQIVDVQPKPKGLTGELSADNPDLQNEEMIESLQSKGIVPTTINNKLELVGVNGELNVGTKDGVQYILRFGNTESSEDGMTEDGKSKLRRYLIVSARVDSSRLKPPSLEPLPSDVPKPPTTEEQEPDPASGGAGQDEVEPGDKPEQADQPEEADKPEQPAAEDAPKKPATTDFDLKRKQIEKENQRRLDEYNERVKKAQAKVKELNTRFGPWYYVISDDEYQKLHLTRSDVIRERTGPGAEGNGIDAFRQLQEEGIKPPPPAPMFPGGPGGPGGGLPPGLNFGS